MRTRGAVAALAALFAMVAAAAPAPARQERTALTPLEATNRLLAVPWGPLSRQLERDAERTIESYEGKTIAGGGGSIGITYKGVGVTAQWRFGVKTHSVSANVDLAPPPGILAASPSELSFAAPRSGGWSFGYQALLEPYAWVKVAGTKIWKRENIRVPFAIGIKNFRLPARLALNSTEPDRPRLVSGTITPTMTVGGAGALPGVIPITFQTTVEQGRITMRANAFSMPLAEFGFANARINAGLRIVLRPLSANDSDEDPIVELGKHRMRMTVTFTGTLTAEIRYVPAAKESFSIDLLSFDANVPTLPELNDALHLTKQETPRRWGESGDRRGWVAAPAPVFDYAAPAAALEAGIEQHLPHGAVLSKDCTVTRAGVRGPLTCDRHTWAGGEDSAIWTGHYLAAESFRYASGETVALPRIERVLSGIERLFWVTGDAAITDGKRVAVGSARGVLARTAMPVAARGRSAPDYTGQPLDKRGCHYVRPEGGWKVGNRSFSTLRAIPTASRDSATPVGIVWHGWGCGDDHPVSKDQYIGVVYGLAAADRLVPVAAVQSRVQALVGDAARYLWANDWSVRLAPSNRVETTFLGDFPKQLAILRLAASSLGGVWRARYAELAPAAESVWMPIWFSASDPITQYYKFNLSHAALTTLFLLEDDPTLRASYGRAHAIMWRAVRHHRNAYFGLLRVLAQPPAGRAALARSTTPWLDPTLTVEGEIRSILQDWVRRYEAVKAADGMPTSSVGDPTVQAGMAAADVGTYIGFEGSARRISVFALPIVGRAGRDKDFVWQRDPFDTAYRGSITNCQTLPPSANEVQRCGSRPNRIHPGVDYLLAYWIARYLGIA